MADRRFETSFKQLPGSDEPGLVLGDDNVVYLIKPDGSRVEVGGGGASPSLPIAAPAGVTVDTTTYDNTITGSGKLTTLVFPASNVGTAVLAIAELGDAFPRWILNCDGTGGLYLGDGTFDPGPNGSGSSVFAQSDQSVGLGNGAGFLEVGTTATNRDHPAVSSRGVVVESGPMITGGSGAPGIGGEVGDIYIRSDGGALTTIYRCTTAGTAGFAVWTGIL